jgi:hypothetical protein
MSAEKEPKYYEEMLDKGGLSQEEVEDNLAQVESIILRLEKGLVILEKVERKPEKKVLDNYARFEVIRSRFLTLIK